MHRSDLLRPSHALALLLYLVRDCATLRLMSVRADPPAGTARLAIGGVAPGGSNWASVFWVDTVTIVPTTAQMNTYSSDLGDLYYNNLKALIGTNWTFDLAKVTYYGASGLVITGETVLSLSGDGSAASIMPDQVAACASWLVDTTWRGGKPRTYLPTPYASAHLLNNAHLTTTWAGTIETASAAFLADVNSYNTSPFTSNTLGTLRFFSKGVPLTSPAFLPYTGVKVNQRLATMRRRLGREIT